MKSFAAFLSVSAVLTGVCCGSSSEWRTLKHYADMKAMESCFGEDVMKQYTVNMKKAVAKCSRQDAPELNLPPFRSTYRFVNTLLSQADEMENQKFQFVYNMMEKMSSFNNHNNYNNKYNSNSFRPHSSSYNQDSWMEKMMKQMMMKKMMNKFEMMFNDNDHSDSMAPTKYMMSEMMDSMDDSSYNGYNKNSFNNFDEKAMMESMMKYKMMSNDNSRMENGNNYRQKMMEILSRSRRQAGGKKDSAVTLPSTLDIGDRLTEKVKDQQRHTEEKIGNMTCVLRECGMLNDQNELDERVQKAYFKKFDVKNKWLVDRVNKDIEMCVQVAKSLPQEYTDEMNFPGFANVAQIKYYMKCIKTAKMKSCMYKDVKQKLESNFGPLEQILDQTQMTENQLLPLVMNILHGDEMEFDY